MAITVLVSRAPPFEESRTADFIICEHKMKSDKEESIMIYDPEDTRYRKRAKRKHNPKAKHKHEYQPCVFEYEGIQHSRTQGGVPASETMMGSYCPVCGEIGSYNVDIWMRWKPVAGGKAGRSEYTEEACRELNSETRTLPTFWLEKGFFQKFVSLHDVEQQAEKE